MRLPTLAAGRASYRVIYADPPWSYRDPTGRGAAASHYSTMTLPELKRLPVPELAHPDGAFFWIWATWPKIRDRVPHELLEHWGLRWVGEVVWDKRRIGPGRWLRSQAEVLILAVAGRPERSPAMARQGNLLAVDDPEVYIPVPSGSEWKGDPGVYIPEVVSHPRSSRHSEKPQIFRDLITRLCPQGPYLELFARAAVPGWDVWGDEAPAE